MAARPQWCLASMGWTNSGHPYCKFATLAIQMTPMINCTHGFASAGVDLGEFKFALIIVLLYRFERTRELKSRIARAGCVDSIWVWIARAGWVDSLWARGGGSARVLAF